MMDMQIASDPRIEQILALYKAGTVPQDIAKRVRMTSGQVKDELERAGIIHEDVAYGAGESIIWDRDEDVRRAAFAKRASDAAKALRKQYGEEEKTRQDRAKGTVSAVVDAFDTAPSVLKARWKQILAEVCAKHDISPMDILSARRRADIVVARQECMWRIRNETPLSLPQIGDRLGGRDHTTILYGVRMHEKRMAEQGGAS